MKKLSKILIIGLISLLAFGCGSSTSPEQQPPKEAVSYEITYQNLELNKSEYSDEVYAYAVWTIENNGTAPLYLSSDDCDIEDKDGNYIGTLDLANVTPQIIEAGEKAYYHAWGSVGEIDPKSELLMLPKVDAEKSTTENIRFKTSDVSIKNDEIWGIDVIGRVENHLEEEVFIDVEAVLFDEEDNPIWVLSDLFYSLRQERKKGLNVESLLRQIL